jgi:putative transposase
MAPCAKSQHCRVHFLRNALANTNKGQRQTLFALINMIFVRKPAEFADKHWRIVTDSLREKFPKLATIVDAAENDGLSLEELSKGRRVKIHSANILERLNG